MGIDKILDTPTDIQRRHESRICNIMFLYPLIKVIQFGLPLQYDLYFMTHCFHPIRVWRFGTPFFLKEFGGQADVNNLKSCIRQRNITFTNSPIILKLNHNQVFILQTNHTASNLLIQSMIED